MARTPRRPFREIHPAARLAGAGWIVVVVFVCIAASFPGDSPSREQRALGRAEASYAGMLGAYRHGRLYSETPVAGGAQAYVWPVSQALAASLAMAGLPRSGPAYRPEVERDLALIEGYRRAGAGVVYEASPGRASTFYDDNEWLALDFLSAYDLLHRPLLLGRAQAIFDQVSAGWSTEPAQCPGGIYWQETPEDRNRAAVTTANGALLALRLYQATGRRSYLSAGRRMVGWVMTCLRRADGLIADHIDAGGNTDERTWSYNQGAVIADLVLLSQATGRRDYLSSARTLARASLTAYAGFADEPRVFVAIFFRDLAYLDEVAPDPRYRRALELYAQTEWNNRDRTTGLFGTPGRYDLLDQAAMAQIYAEISAGGP